MNYLFQVGLQECSASLTVTELPLGFVKGLPEISYAGIRKEATFVVELTKDVPVNWWVGNDIIEDNDKYTTFADNRLRKLIVKDVLEEDQLVYACTMAEDTIETSSKLEIEAVENAPKIEEYISEYRIKNGEDVTFTVKYNTNMGPRDEWSVNGKYIIKSKKVESKLTNVTASLTLRKLEDVDTGTYKLRLRNNCGEDSAEIKLTVIDKPSRPGLPEPVGTTDSSVTLFWKAPENIGNSPITNYVIEYHDRATQAWSYTSEKITQTTHTISNLTKDSEITFRVTAFNDVGASEPSEQCGYIKITAPVAVAAPVVQEPLKDIITGLNKELVLSCVISGNPVPEIEWCFNSKTVEKTTKMTYESRCAKYVIETTTETTSGTYSCKAKNSAGEVETTCKVTVQDAPTLEIEKEFISQRLKCGETWEAKVKLTGYPKPEIKWLKDNCPVRLDDNIKVVTDATSTTLTNAKLEREDTATYTVTASNDAGSAVQLLQLQVVGKLYYIIDLLLETYIVKTTHRSQLSRRIHVYIYISQ